MRITEITENKRRYMDLLLLADEQEDMVERYLDRGTMYALEDRGTVRAVCVVTGEGDGVLEIKNLAVEPGSQRQGYGGRMVRFLREQYAGSFQVLQVGTGESPLTVPFYERCGFRRSHVVKDFFTRHYDHPIYEAGHLLTDMVYFRMAL